MKTKETRSVDVCGGGLVCLESLKSAFYQFPKCSTNIITKQLKRDFENFLTVVYYVGCEIIWNMKRELKGRFALS